MRRVECPERRDGYLEYLFIPEEAVNTRLIGHEVISGQDIDVTALDQGG